jgi:hypothetical protein
MTLSLLRGTTATMRVPASSPAPRSLRISRSGPSRPRSPPTSTTPGRVSTARCSAATPDCAWYTMRCIPSAAETSWRKSALPSTTSSGDRSSSPPSFARATRSTTLRNR